MRANNTVDIIWYANIVECCVFTIYRVSVSGQNRTRHAVYYNIMYQRPTRVILYILCNRYEEFSPLGQSRAGIIIPYVHRTCHCIRLVARYGPIIRLPRKSLTYARNVFITKVI